MPRLSSLLTTFSTLAAVFGCSSTGGSAGSALGGAAGAGASSGSGTGAGASTGMGGATLAAAGAVSGGAGATAAGGVDTAGGAGTAAGGGGASGGSGPGATGKALVFVGGYGAEPVRAYDLDMATGALTERMPRIDAGPEPTCLTLDASRSHLYVCNEDDSAEGGVTSFTLHAEGTLEKLNHQLGSDGGFTALALSPDGKLLAGAGYNGGSASTFSIGADGAVGAEVGNADFGGEAQTHYCAFDPSGKYLLATTKGLNEVQQLRVLADGTISPNSPASVSTAETGPRHLAVHPNGKLAFVVTERGSTLIPYQLAANGTLTAGVSVSTLPSDYQGQNTGAHVELAPGGQLLYVSNRGHDSIGVFQVDQQTGELTLKKHFPTNGASPHDFDIDASGKVLITANRKGNSLSVFHVEADGMLTPQGDAVPTRAEPTAVLIVDL